MGRRWFWCQRNTKTNNHCVVTYKFEIFLNLFLTKGTNLDSFAFMFLITSLDKSDDKEIPDNLISFFIWVIYFSSWEHFIISLIKVASFYVLDSASIGLNGVLIFLYFIFTSLLFDCFFTYWIMNYYTITTWNNTSFTASDLSHMDWIRLIVYFTWYNMVHDITRWFRLYINTFL